MTKGVKLTKRGWKNKPFSKLNDRELRRAFKFLANSSLDFDKKILTLYERILDLHKENAVLLELYMELKEAIQESIKEGEPDEYIV